MSLLRTLRRSPGTAAAIVASAAVLGGATVAGSALFAVRLGPLRLVSRLDVAGVADTAPRWGERWEMLALSAAAAQREALGTLVRTAGLLTAGTAAVALLSLAMHAAGRLLSQWRPLTIRRALGAPLRNLLLRTGGELCFLGAVGSGLGAIAGFAVLSGMGNSWPELIERPALSVPAAAAAAAAGIGVAVLLAAVAAAMLYPLQRRVHLVADLHGDHLTETGGVRLAQSALAALQLAALLAVTYGSLLVLRAADAGDSDSALPWDPHTVAMAPATRGSEDAPGAVASHDAWVGLSSRVPVIGQCGDCFIGLMLVPVTSATVQWAAVGPGALGAMSLPMIHGRDFTAADSSGTRRVVILSRAANHRLFLSRDPTGKELWTGIGAADRYTVVGVTGDFAPTGLGLTGAPLLMAFVPRAQHSPPLLERARRGATRLAARERLLDGRVAALRAPLLWFGGVFRLLAGSATVLGLFSLAAAMSELVESRRRDIAIRLAVGGRPRHIVAWVAARALGLTGVGVLLGMSGARWVGFLLAEHIGVGAEGDLLALGRLCLVFMLVGGIAGLLPARRAARLQPATIFTAGAGAPEQATRPRGGA